MMKTVLRTLFLSGLSVIAAKSFGQSYYPAGLGNANLSLWLTAADPTTLKNPSNAQAANGNALATWTDKSGSGANATQAASGFQPIYSTNQQNGFGGVIFQNANEYMTGPNGNYETLISVRAIPSTGIWQYLFSVPANTDFSIRSSSSSNGTYTNGPNGNDWSNNTGNPTSLWINGDQNTTGSTTTTHIVEAISNGQVNGTYSLSNYNPSAAWGGRGMSGNDPVYELLGYSTALNNTQRILLENYEASMWGLTSLLNNGETNFTPPSVSTYNRNLVGIGNIGGGDNFLSDVSGSTDGLGFTSTTANTGFLKNDGFIMAAHNGQAATVIANTTIAGVTNLSRWNRSWYLEESGGKTTGTITVTFSFSDYNGSAISPAFKYFYILYNATDGSFATGTNKLIATTMTTSGATVPFSVTASTLANGYYTLIYSTSPITLPVELTGFTAEKEQNTSFLEWTAESNTGIGRFDVTRSTDGITFDSIGTIPAATDYATYSFTDEHPVMGQNYYRIRMLDLKDNVTNSDVVTVDFSPTTRPALSFYPNPSTDVLHVKLNNTAVVPVSIQVYSLQGQCVYTYNNGSSSGTVDIPVNQLPTGMYFVKVDVNGVLSTEKVVKE